MKPASVVVTRLGEVLAAAVDGVARRRALWTRAAQVAVAGAVPVPVPVTKLRRVRPSHDEGCRGVLDQPCRCPVAP